MNKKGDGIVVVYGFMIAIVIFILIMSFAPVIKEFVDDAMGETIGDFVGLSCSSTEDNFLKTTCIVTDMTNFLFSGTLLFIAGAIIVAKVVF